MEVVVQVKEKHLAVDICPLYVRVGFARAVGGFTRRPNIALAYGLHEIRIIRAIGRGMREQRRQPSVAIYDNTVQVVYKVEPILGELRASLATLTMPPLQKVVEVCSIASSASFTPDDDFRTFRLLQAGQKEYGVEIYGPHGTKIKAFETFFVKVLGDKASEIFL